MADNQEILDRGISTESNISHGKKMQRDGRRIFVFIFIAVFIIIVVGSSIVILLYASHHTAISTSTPTSANTSYPSYLLGHGTLILSDPLDGASNQKNAQGWKAKPGCQFTGGHYQIATSSSIPLRTCLGPSLQNFAFEVQMTITKGDCGEILFRANISSNTFYDFLICQQGIFSLAKVVGDHPGIPLLQPTASSNLNPELNQVNTLAIVASGNSISLYANKHLLGGIQDNSSSAGLLALGAVETNGPTIVAFSHARIWSL
jgi:hypothetical protein